MKFSLEDGETEEEPELVMVQNTIDDFYCYTCKKIPLK